MAAVTAKEIDEAWGRVGNTDAGQLARERLVEILTSLAPSSDNASALFRHEGRRTLARELLVSLDQYAGHDGRDSNDDYPSPERSPIERGRRRSLRRVSALPEPSDKP